jgi:hypothetical protein
MDSREATNAEVLFLLRKVNAFIELAEREKRLVAKSQRTTLQKARAILAAMGKKEERLLDRINATLKEHEGILDRMLKVNQNLDETLCNLLLAIRQQEFLHAWYPPQKGEPEKQVIGKYLLPRKQDQEAT